MIMLFISANVLTDAAINNFKTYIETAKKGLDFTIPFGGAGEINKMDSRISIILEIIFWEQILKGIPVFEPNELSKSELYNSLGFLKCLYPKYEKNLKKAYTQAYESIASSHSQFLFFCKKTTA